MPLANDYKIYGRLFPLEYLINKVDFNSTDHQTAWLPPDDSEFIESVLLDLPLGDFWVWSNNTHTYLVDGFERLRTVKSFLACEFGLEYLDILENLNGLYASGIGSYYQRKFGESHVVVTIVQTDNEAIAHSTITRCTGRHKWEEKNQWKLFNL